MRAPRLALASLALASLASLAAAQAPFTTRIDKAPGDALPDDSASAPAISADGMFVAFASQAKNLPGAAPATPNTWALFVRDVRTGVIELVNLGSQGQILGPVSFNGDSWGPRVAISQHGRYVAFTSTTNDPALGDNNDLSDVFLRDRLLGTTELISVGASGTGTLGSTAYRPSISDDGRFVAFIGNGNEFVANPPPAFVPMRHAYVRDRQTGTTEAASHITESALSIDMVEDAVLSGDGSKVVYLSKIGFFSDELTVMLSDRSTGTSRPLVELTLPGIFELPQGVAIDRTGSKVAFYAREDGLVPGDDDGLYDIFVIDVARHSIELVSAATDGAQGASSASNPSLSPCGRYVAFQSSGEALAPGAGTDLHVYVRDLETGLTTLGSSNDKALPGAAAVGGYALLRGPRALSDSGRVLVLESTYQNLAAPSLEGLRGIFRRDRRTDGPELGISSLSAGQTATLHVTGATPAGPLLIGLSTSGQGPFPSYWGHVHLTPPLVVLQLTADASGVARKLLPIDPALLGVHVFAQGLDVAASYPTTAFHGLVH